MKENRKGIIKSVYFRDSGEVDFLKFCIDTFRSYKCFSERHIDMSLDDMGSSFIRKMVELVGGYDFAKAESPKPAESKPVIEKKSEPNWSTDPKYDGIPLLFRKYYDTYPDKELLNKAYLEWKAGVESAKEGEIPLSMEEVIIQVKNRVA